MTAIRLTELDRRAMDIVAQVTGSSPTAVTREWIDAYGPYRAMCDHSRGDRVFYVDEPDSFPGEGSLAATLLHEAGHALDARQNGLRLRSAENVLLGERVAWELAEALAGVAMPELLEHVRRERDQQLSLYRSYLRLPAET